MSMNRITYTRVTGETVVYEYPPTGYYVTAEQRCLKALKKRPLRRIRTKGGTGGRWTLGQRGPVFNDKTVVALIEKGLAVCLGDFVELKVARR